ncbi:MAG TPA: metallophosphoesterase [Kofleriaceae bacterium]|nr:metallophosphoesterase [Kofleriaceae bacterium]
MIEAPEIRGLLEKDLRRVHDVSGPWDFVAITGNITAGGDPDEFAHAENVIAWLWDWLHVLGSEPALVMVPGPCDLDARVRSAAKARPPSTPRKPVSPSIVPAPGFRNYAAFAADLARRLQLKYAHPGLLPGDSSRVLDRDELRVAVLGLNTSLRGRPVGHIRHDQLSAACGMRDVAGWMRANDAVVVVTCHGGDRLDPDSAHRLSEIPGPVLALCGPHQAAPDAQSSCDGRQVVLPGLSLARFELNRFGYRAGRMTMSGDTPVVRDWIRQLAGVAGTSSLGPLVASAVDADGSTTIAFRTGPSTLAAHEGSPVIPDPQIRHVAWSPDGGQIAVIRGQGTLEILDHDGSPVHAFSVHSSTPCALAWSPDGNRLATRSRFHLRIWSVDGEREAEVDLPCLSPTAMAWIGRDTLLLAGDDGLHIWGSGKLRKLWGIARRVLTLAASPHRGHIVLSTDDATWLVELKSLIELSTPRLVSRDIDFQNVLDPVVAHAAACSPSEAIFAIGGTDGVVTLWDMEGRTRLARLEGLTDTVRSLAFSRDGTLLAATAIDGSHGVWSCQDRTPRSLGALRGVRNLNAIAFSPTADVVALGGMIGLRIVPLAAGEPIAADDAPDGADEPMVRTASAKVVLLGEGNVGKSCLALRLTQDRYEELGSTHGLRFWSVPLERLDPDASIPPGERREVVFWDMGGQHEYQLLHHAFLHDTMLALMVMEPRRGEAALRELEVWDRQLAPDRTRLQRMLIGSKLDDDRVPRDPALVERALAEHGFAGYAETSARTGVGIDALRRAIARTIDWRSVAVTTRPQLFHRIRHYVELRRTARRVALPYLELEDIVKQREGDDVDLGVVGAVVEQLARQGLIADARLRDGSRMLILEVEQVECYAASLILAARDNPRGVPALEMASVGLADMSFPRIAPGDRLPRDQELVVLDCVVALLINAGICFLSGRLLIFPALFREGDDGDGSSARGAVAVAYDFLGAIDRIYSALVCWLALDVRFGALRLSQHRVELATPGRGTCGVRRIARPEPGGAGRFEVYFDGDTDDATRVLFAAVVDDFLRDHGVEMIEQLTVGCACSYVFSEDDVRYRLAHGHGDILCPRCEHRVPLVRTGTDTMPTDGLAASLRAFRSERLQNRRRAAVAARNALEEAPRTRAADRPVHILHLSDLHISAGTDLTGLLQPLCSDLEDRVDGLGDHRPDLVVVSGDLTNRATPEEFAAARSFLVRLLDRCKLTAERCVVVPGNHDLSWDAPAYSWQPRRHVPVVDPAQHVAQGNGFLIRDERGYAERFRNFSEHFFHPLFQRPYSLVPEEQALCALFEDLGIQIIALNSAWQIDEWFPGRSSIHLGALARMVELADAALADARTTGRLAQRPRVLRIAVWHHPITGNEKIVDDAFVDSLRRAGVELCLHGHVHEDRADVIAYLHPRKLRVVGAGSFGAPSHDRPESVPRLYNLIEIDAARSGARVHTRQLRRSGAAWEPWCVWPGATGGERRPYYEVEGIAGHASRGW